MDKHTLIKALSFSGSIVVSNDLILATYATLAECGIAAEHVDRMLPKNLSIQIFYRKSPKEIIRYYLWPLPAGALG
jgi:hypothetical protein